MFKGVAIGDNLDAFNVETREISDVSDSEIMWNNEYITKQYIHSIKEFGFNIIRLPVTWFNHIEIHNSELCIQSKFIQRIREIIQWCIDEKMYVILNTHHDESWIAHNNNEKEVIARLIKIWDIILSSFNDLSTEYLIFEDMNEVGFEKEEGHYSRFYRLSKLLYNKIRKYNKDRKLIQTCVWGDPFKMQETQAMDFHNYNEDHNLYLNFHLYYPFEFTFGDDAPPIETEWIPNRIIESGNAVMKAVTAFKNSTNARLICTEFASNILNRRYQDIELWYKRYIRFFKENNIGYILWDDGSERSIFDRKDDTLKLKPELKGLKKIIL